MSRSTDPRTPNFFILGAAKAGTTSLYAYLSQHPEIYLSEVKEPQFFCHEGLYAKGLDYYLDRFFPGSQEFSVRCEATLHYLYYAKVARRLAETLPGDTLKFIVILRDPVARAYSLYWNMVAEGKETLSFPEAIAAERERSLTRDSEATGELDYQYLESGLYARQLKAYFEYFDPEQFLILFFDDLKSQPEQTLRRVFRFLGVTEEPPIEMDRAHNRAGRPRSRRLQQLLRRPNPVKKALGRLLPEPVKYRLAVKLLNLNKKPFDYPPLEAELASRLSTRFQDDIRELEALTGRPLTHWLRGS